MRAYSDLLRGVRVVELCWAWAGPLAARTMADLGAEVIKVEGPNRPDGVRFDTYADLDPGEEPWNRGGHMQKHARNKKSLVVDLNRPEGREAFLRLIEKSDIFVENNSPRVLPNLGITYDDLAARNPRIIMVSMPGFGSSGPFRDWVGFGLNLESFCGLSTVTGYPDTGPVRSAVPYGDPIAGLHAAVAMLAALRQVRREGRGRFIEVAQNESLMNVLIEPWIRANALHEAGPPQGCHHEFIAPHNIYEAKGDDAWVAIVAKSPESFAALGRIVGHPEWATDAALQSPYDRKAREPELDAAIGAWTIERERDAIVSELTAAGVPCAPARRVDELLSDPLLARREYWTEIDHPVVGRRTYAHLPFRFWRSVRQTPTHAPLYGEHNREVLEGIVGMTPEEVDQLEASGIVVTRPNMA